MAEEEEVEGGGSRRQSRQGPTQSPIVGPNAVPVTQKVAASSTPASAPQIQAEQQRDTPAAESSRPATPSQARTAPSRLPADEVQKASPVPYWYEYVTDEAVGSWQERGRSLVQHLAEEGDEARLSTIVQELVRSSLDGRLNAAEAGSVVRQTISHHSENGGLDVQSLFLNTLSLLEDSDTKSPNLLTLVAATDIDPDVIRLELDIPLLQAMSLVRTSFTQMRTRKTTNVLYRQANFNLLREETEGYAKLITEYFNTATEAVTNPNVSAEEAFQRTMALVGSFDLDVGRVLDITLDISANLLVRTSDFVVKFYRCSTWWPDGGVLDNVKWEDQGFNSVPPWALPGSGEAGLTSEERVERRREQMEDLASMRETRDIAFWQHAKEVGTEAFFGLGARKIVDFDSILPLLETEAQPEYDARQKEINADRRKRINENRRYMRETRTLPPPGNSDAAQLLGFKIRFYASTAREKDNILPENLIHLAALLIKTGFISLRDLYPHLYPADEMMAEERARLAKEKAEKEARERPGGGANALAMAGALTDDTLPVARNLRDKERSGANTPKADKNDEESKEELPTPANQKIILLKALLAIGALPEALYILGRFPWLVEVDISLPPYLHRVANQMLSTVAESVRPLNSGEDTQRARAELKDLRPAPDGNLLFKQGPEKKVTKWLGLDRVDRSDGLTYRHYYLEWDDNIPRCQNVEDVFLLCNTFQGYLGVKIGQDPQLHSTLVRIAKRSLTEDASEFNRSRWLELMKRLLVPALSLSKHNPGLTQEVYELLKFYPTTMRYNVYAEWYLGKTSRLPDMRVAFDHNRAEIKDVLRRVTNETGKKQARALAKVSFSSPGVVMMSMINQLESYSNMIPSLVECTRYFSLLAYDVLTWCLINSLSGQGRDRMQADGMLTSPWLQALSQFVASLFNRYSVVNPSPVLQYLASELRMGNSTDLEMFEQVLAEMAGIRSDMEFNDAQVLAMAGGEHLQAQIVLQLADKRYARKDKASRLIKALADPGLIGQMLIAIAQERQMYPHHDSSKFMPLKVLGNNLDKIQQVFAQYLEVLKTNLRPEEFEDAVPNIMSLVADFGLEPGIAFTICRMVLVHRMTELDAVQKQESVERKRRLSQEESQPHGDTEMQDGEAEPVINGDGPTPGTTALEEGETEDTKDTALVSQESKATNAPQPSGAVTADGDGNPWHPVLEPIIQGLSETAVRLADKVSIPFFVTFWTLTLQDVLVHPASYENEIKKLQNQVKEISASRADVTAITVKERERKKKALIETQDKLQNELRGRIAAYTKTRQRLSRREKHHWFSRAMDREEIDARHIGLLQECFLPRAMLSSLDAHYCFLMLKILHDNGTPGFSTMVLLSQLMRKRGLAAIMCQCTAMEAQHFGRFLCETLKLLQHWHADKPTYEKEALGGKQKLPGFAKKVDANGEPEVVLEYEDFRRLLYNWHRYLHDSLQMCFESGEYMHIRNGIIVLKSVVQVFPLVNFMGHGMVKHVTKLSEEDLRQDLKLAAMSLLGPLRNREMQWMMPQAFRLNDPSKESGRPGSRAPSARPETPQPSMGTPKLNAAAPEFKPPPANVTNGDARKESLAGTEDGEIEDEKQAKGGDAEMKDVAESIPDTEVSQAKAPDPKGVSEPVSTMVNEAQKAASKPPTPAPAPAKPPPPAANEPSRPDSTRPLSTQPAPSRALHALPSRPEARPPPNKPLPAPPADRGARYPNRPEDRYGRLDRPNEVRPGSRDHSPGSRSRGRTPERDPYYPHPGTGRGPPRDERIPPRSATDGRYARDDSYSSSRREQAPQPPLHSRPSHDARDRANGTMGPPPPQMTHTSRASQINSAASGPPSRQDSRPPNGTQTSQSQPPDTQYNENPARLALINKDQAQGQDRGRDAPEAQKDVRRERDVRDERTPHSNRSSTGRIAPSESPRELRSRSDQPGDLAPTGPRQARGRLSQDLGSQVQPESSYGRLNGPQDIPPGARAPNGPGGRGGRNFTAPQPPLNTRSNEQPLPSPSAVRPPDSPAAFRGPSQREAADRRNSGSQFERQASPNSVPTTTATDSGPSVHPSRMAQLSAQPSPLQTNLPASGVRNAASPSSAPPIGPRGPTRLPAGTPTGPSPTTNGPPLGPASAVERARRDNRQRASINATLQSANTVTGPNGQSVSFRGAAQNRQPSMPMSSSATVQPVQAIASPMEPPQRRNEPPSHQKPAPNRPESRPDLFQGRQDRGNEPDNRGDSRQTSGRREDDPAGRQRSSRHPSRERRPDDEPPRRPPPPGMEDRREKRGGLRDERTPRDDRGGREGPPQRDTRGQERPLRNDDVPPRRPPPAEALGSFSGPPLDWERRSDRRGPDDSRRGGRGAGRGEDFRGGRREDGMRDGGRGPRDEGPPPLGVRKRRHEDGGPFDESKRRRSGR